MKKKCKLLVLISMLFLVLTACGAKTEAEVLAKMTPFTSPDGSVTISMNNEWVSEDAGMENWIMAGNKLETEFVMTMQLPKYMYGTVITSIDDLKANIKDNYGMTNIQDLEAFTLTGTTNTATQSGTISAEGDTAEAYVVYGETDYAFYAIIGVSRKLTDKFETALKATCSSLQEVVPEIENNGIKMLKDLQLFVKLFFCE